MRALALRCLEGLDQFAAARVDHVPVKPLTLELRHIKNMAVGRDRHTVAAFAVVGAFPDELIGDEIERAQPRDGAHIQQTCDCAGRDSSNFLGLLAGRRGPTCESV